MHRQTGTPTSGTATDGDTEERDTNERDTNELDTDERDTDVVTVVNGATRERAEAVLRELAGPGALLREDQWRAIEALVVDHRRALVVQRTGWGKSAVYFVATALLRAQGSGPTLIVSPLLALMRNQVEAAGRAGIHARTINSANPEEWSTIEDDVRAGAVDVLLISPERLNSPGFRDDVLPRMADSAGLVVVDEAHCISDWGHDFRPDYRRLRDVLAGLRPDVPVLATTATANERVTADVAEQLGASHDGTPPLVLRGSLDRTSLHLGVLRLPTSSHRLAWLGAHLDDLPGSGIIYALTVSQADDVATFLRERGHAVASYSGRTEAADRAQAEQDLLDNRIKALVATSALGMGFDKPDLGFVVHVGAPSSPIAYYQQVGRAGRAVDRAHVLLLPGPEDEDIWRWYASVAFPPEAVVRRTLEVLTDAGKPMSTAALEPQVDVGRSRLEQMLKVLDVDGAVTRVRGGWSATGVPWDYDAKRYARVAEARAREQQAMRDYIATDGCRLAFLRRQLDDPETPDCGRCDRCAAPFYPAAVDERAAAQAREQSRRPGVEIAPRAMWPTAMAAVGVPLSGRIAAAEAAVPGRAIGRRADIGWGPRLRDVLGPDPELDPPTGAASLVAAGGPPPVDAVSPVPPAGDGTGPAQPFPEADGATVPAAKAAGVGTGLAPDLVDALVDVLRHWNWDERPTSVAWIAGRRHGALAEAAAREVARIGRLPLAGSVDVRQGADSASRTNSAQRVRALHDAFSVRAEVANAVRTAGGPVLLLDAMVGTGWTMTLAARELRRAGASAVLPLALALDG